MMFRVLAVVLLLVIPAEAVPNTEKDKAPRLKVGVFERPPFAIKDKDGHWSGLAVELWEGIAQDLKLEYDFEEVPLEEVISRLDRGELDVIVGEMGVSAERRRLVNYTQPYLSTSAGVAVLQGQTFRHSLAVLTDLIKHGLGIVLLGMFVLLILFSVLLWIAERRHDKTHFGGKPIHGLGSALWFAAVTMTTVGYGDKTPQTPLGRMLAFFWMFLGILLVSAFTGAVASGITMARLNENVVQVRDLARFRNGVLEKSLCQGILDDAGISSIAYPSLNAGLDALKEGKISAFVSDATTLRYMVNMDPTSNMRVVSLPTTKITFAIPSRRDLPQAVDIDTALINRVSNPNWHSELERWTGPSSE